MISFLHNLFVPHPHNNHRSKLLHNSSLLIAVFSLLSVSLIFITIHRSHPNVLGVSYSISADDLLKITNSDRQQNGLPPLSLNNELTSAAQGKAANMFQNDYWAHFAPDGTSPWDFIKGAGYNYSYAGENLAKGFTSSSDIVQAWMNSPSHRENMLSNKYKDVGFAIQEGNLLGEDTVLVVEEFGAPVTPVIVDNNAAQVQAANVDPLAETPSAGSSANPTPSVKPRPTPIPAKVILGDANKLVVVTKKPSQSFFEKASINLKPEFDFSNQTRVLAIGILAVFAVALLLDFIVTEKKKIPRLVGHNLDHIMLISFAIIILILQAKGGIL